MSEDFEEQEAQPLDLSRYVDLVRRRHIQFLMPLFLGWLLVWGSSWFLQARYISSTLILVEEPTMPKNYVVPNVNDDLQARLQSISQQILSRTRLLLIIDKHNLYNEQERSVALSQTTKWISCGRTSGSNWCAIGISRLRHSGLTTRHLVR